MENKEITIPAGKDIALRANLNIPSHASSLVIFSHGAGSSRFSPRNNYVAGVLNNEKIATLLIDLLTEKEDEVYENRFDIKLLTERLVTATHYACKIPELKELPIAYFGASTGAASAIAAAAELKNMIYSVVSRGGRPDLASSSLPVLKAPTLLIVGSLDREVITLNEYAFDIMQCEKKMEIVEGASHLFEEKNTLEQVSVLARDWFIKHLKDLLLEQTTF